MKKFILIITIIGIATSCRTIDPFLEVYKNPDINELLNFFHNYRYNQGTWPSKETWDSLKANNYKFKRFSRADFSVYQDTLKLNLELNYGDYENVFRNLKMKPVLAQSGMVFHNITGITIQPDIELKAIELGNKIRNIEQIGIQTKLSSVERMKFQKWDKARKSNSKLWIQETKTGKIKKIRVNSIIYISSRLDSLGYRYPVFDSVTRTTFHYPSHGWIVTNINHADSTLDVNYAFSESVSKRIKYSDIRFLNVKNRRGRYKVLESWK